MSYKSTIHSKAQLVKAILGNFEKNILGINYSANELIVVNYHSTPKKFDKNFEEQVNFFKNNFNIISPAEAEDFYSAKGLQSKKCNLLFTFDDGLKNNLNAVKILEKNNIKALFFVVPDFINTPAQKQKEYYIKNIRPVINSAIDAEEEDFIAMSWKELQELVNSGHTIGAHSQTHTLIAEISDLNNSQLEIAGCKKNIETQLNRSINSFCSINNTAVSVGKKEKELIAQNYKFHFTTFPGSNAVEKNALLIKRRNVESFWMKGSIYYAIGKLDLKRWKPVINKYQEL